jgi:hypothetical protein
VIENPKYDVALSFLGKDADIASALNEKLSQSLQVFFFPRRQDELAGTEGLESLRKPFLDDSRVVVVLYRDGWGKTPWTGVEETAIKDGCLAGGWQRLFFIVLDKASALPSWLPHTHIWFHYDEYGLAGAVGAIKARVQEHGGHIQPMTPRKRAEMLKAEEQFQLDKARMNSENGIKEVHRSIDMLFQEIKRQCSDIKNGGMANIYCGIDSNEGQITQMCMISTGTASIGVVWNQLFGNDLKDAELTIREFKGRVSLSMDVSHHTFRDVPFRELAERSYSPDLSPAREYGWKQKGTSEFVSSPALAEQCVMKLMELATLSAKGQLT